MTPPRLISANDLGLVLVARRTGSPTRFAAMSNGVKTQRCGAYGTRWGFKHGPLFQPMERGDFHRVLDAVRSHGAAELRRTFGAGIKALRAETQSPCMQRGGR